MRRMSGIILGSCMGLLLIVNGQGAEQKNLIQPTEGRVMIVVAGDTACHQTV